jgi:hypothetical protein
MLANDVGNFESRVGYVLKQAVAQPECAALHSQNACGLVCLLGAHAWLREFGGSAVGQVDEQHALASTVSLASVSPIWVSASSGCAAMTSAS